MNDTANSNQEKKLYFYAIISFIILLMGLVLEHLVKPDFFQGNIVIALYLCAYIPVGLPVIKESIESLQKGNIFNEFFLMSIATIGAFFINQYPEAVAVMLFYTVGELFQNSAIKKSKANITALLDVRPKIAHVFRDGMYTTVKPETVQIKEKIQIKVGEKVPLDGKLLSSSASLNTAALTGESKPKSLKINEKIFAGSINLENVIQVEVEKLFNDSSVARILDLVQNASAKKAKTELLIRKLAKIYTPIVVYLAIAICTLPYFFVDDYQFKTWLYRALIFLVISCPCALVISIPLGYFGGLGAASKNGILFKGATYIDILTNITTLIMDKTGTVTKGIFVIKDIHIVASMEEAEFMSYLLALEKKSTHPIAKAIAQYTNIKDDFTVQEVKEISGKGLKGDINGKEVLAGNTKLLDEYKVSYPADLHQIIESVVVMAIDHQYVGYVTIADEVKEDAKQTIQGMKKLGIKEIIMLSGDKDSITQKMAQGLSIDIAKGDLLPEDKLNFVENLKKDNEQIVAFIGDGINDAPVLAASDLSIAMGAMGSDVAIETANIVIQTDEPSKFITAYNISTSTQKVVWQNIILAFSIKILVLILGSMGMASLWEAVFADVGVALLSILNAVRLQKMKF